MDGLATLPPVAPYWGEIPKDQMDALLAASERDGWRNAVGAVPEAMRDNIMKTERAAFQDVIPIPEGSAILDIGAGMGCLSAELAARHRVVALEGVPERARFIALRKRQDGLENLTVINADLNRIRFGAGQFDAGIVNGVLEWVGLFDLSVPPSAGQIRFLQMLRSALRPSGFLYIGIENRIGMSQIMGARDHSGLRYTSLLPRFVAAWVCRRGARYRTELNAGYRTYTYSYYGYRRLFRRAGLEIVQTWVAPLGYNLPTWLVPLHRGAIQLHVEWNWVSGLRGGRAAAKDFLKRSLARPWFWRLFGPDFVFLLRPFNA